MGESFSEEEINDFMKYALYARPDESNDGFDSDMIDITKLCEIMMPNISALSNPK